jgi:membrane protease YdiL (CAAX protease family)
MIWSAGAVSLAWPILTIIPTILFLAIAPGLSDMMLMAFTEIAFLAALYVFLHMRGVAGEVTEPGDVNLLVCAMAVGAVFAIFFVSDIVTGVLVAVFGPAGAYVDPDFEVMLEMGRPIEILLAAVLLGPLLEELVYRGFLMGVLLARGWQPVAASAVAALLFAIQHIQYGWIGILGVAIAGFGLGLLRVAGGGLFAPVIAHMVANALQTLI